MPLRIVLAGGGLCNIQVLKLLHDQLSGDYAEEVNIVLVSNQEWTYYSPMYPGLVAGQYSEEQLKIDLSMLALACNAALVIGEIEEICSKRRVVKLADGTDIEYDILSVNLGSRTACDSTVTGLSDHSLVVRPLSTFLSQLKEIESDLLERKEAPLVVIAGSGATGVELSLALKSRLSQCFERRSVTVTLVESRADVFPEVSGRCREVVAKNLAKAGVKALAGVRFTAVRANEVDLSDGSSLRANVVICATGPDPVTVRHDLETCRRGYIAVERSLRSSASRVFAGGDCVTIKGFPAGFPPKCGAHALMEGPIIAANIAAMAKHYLRKLPMSLMLYEPPASMPLLMNLGDGRGIITKYGMTFSGQWVFALKDHLDKEFMRTFSPEVLLSAQAYTQYRELHPVSPPPAPAPTEQPASNCSELTPQQRSQRSDSYESEVSRMSAELALDLVIESSDTTKDGSSKEYELQFAVMKRTDRDMDFRNAIVKAYEDVMRAFALRRRRSERDVIIGV